MWVKTLLLLCSWVSSSVCGIVGSQKNTDVPTILHGGVASQSFTKSAHDAALVYEFLLGGLVINSDNNISLMDEELASMRQGRAFTAHLNDHVPKTLVAMEKLLALTSTQEKSLHPLRFEIFILGAVYSAYQMKRQTSEQDQQAWGGVLARLASAALSDLHSNVISN